jgi:hypothetical protein
MDTIGIPGPVDDGGDNQGDDSRSGEANSPHPSGNEEGSHLPDQSSADQKADQAQRDSARRQRSGPRPRSGPRQQKQQPAYHVPTLADIKVMKSRLAVMVGTGAISPQQSNAMLAAICSLEKSLQAESRETGPSGLDKQGLKEKLKKNPDLLHLLEPLLSAAELNGALEDREEEENSAEAEDSGDEGTE